MPKRLAILGAAWGTAAWTYHLINRMMRRPRPTHTLRSSCQQLPRRAPAERSCTLWAQQLALEVASGALQWSEGRGRSHSQKGGGAGSDRVAPASA
jgi:hypothetical protein